jgi:hypothetical protein
MSEDGPIDANVDQGLLMIPPNDPEVRSNQAAFGGSQRSDMSSPLSNRSSMNNIFNELKTMNGAMQQMKYLQYIVTASTVS